MLYQGATKKKKETMTAEIWHCNALFVLILWWQTNGCHLSQMYLVANIVCHYYKQLQQKFVTVMCFCTDHLQWQTNGCHLKVAVGVTDVTISKSSYDNNRDFTAHSIVVAKSNKTKIFITVNLRLSLLGPLDLVKHHHSVTTFCTSLHYLRFSDRSPHR